MDITRCGGDPMKSYEDSKLYICCINNIVYSCNVATSKLFGRI